MRVPAVAIGATQTTASIAVFGYGEFGQATAALLAAGGHRVQLLGGLTPAGQICDIRTLDNAQYTATVSFEVPVDMAEVARQSDCFVVAVNGTEYGAMVEDLSDVLSSGQTLMLVGAAFGASLEVAQRLQRKRTDLSLNIVEVDCPFGAYDISGAGVQVTGVKDRVILAGRSLNETRSGLSVGSQLFNSLVPASNLFERGFASIERWLQTAALLFDSFVPAPADNFFQLLVVPTGGKRGSEALPERNMKPMGREALDAVLRTLRVEIQSLAKAYGVSRLPQSSFEPAEVPRPVLKHELGRRIIEDFIVLSSLARIVYLPLPMLESVIELSSVVTGLDLRKEGRDLSDLGLIGMDAHEIIEHVNA